MAMIVVMLRSPFPVLRTLFPKLPTLPTFVSALISKATYLGNVNDMLDMFLSKDPPGDYEAQDGFHPESESEGSELDDDFPDADVDPELASTTRATDHDNTNEVVDVEELGANNSPLLNHAEQAEVEESQGPGRQLEIEEFGGKAGKPIRVSCHKLSRLLRQSEDWLMRLVT